MLKDAGVNNLINGVWLAYVSRLIAVYSTLQ